MVTFISVLIVLGFAILGFLIAEFQNAFLGTQEKTSKLYFSIIGVDFTQKDFQRLIFAILLSIGVMFLLPILIEISGYEFNGYLVYIITGYSPSTVLMFFKKKIKAKTNS